MNAFHPNPNFSVLYAEVSEGHLIIKCLDILHRRHNKFFNLARLNEFLKRRNDIFKTRRVSEHLNALKQEHKKQNKKL